MLAFLLRLKRGICICYSKHQLIKSAWDKKIALEDLTKEEQNALRAVNIAHPEQETFIKDLAQRWGEQFSRDTSYARKITEAFLLADDAFHLTKFDYVHPQQLFRPTSSSSEIKRPSACSVATTRDAFFAGATTVATEENQSLLKPRP